MSKPARATIIFFIVLVSASLWWLSVSFVAVQITPDCSVIEDKIYKVEQSNVQYRLIAIRQGEVMVEMSEQNCVLQSIVEHWYNMFLEQAVRSEECCYGKN